ncbi:MAG: hypothetical protein QM479_08100 [Pseudomonadota bacterium]
MEQMFKALVYFGFILLITTNLMAKNFIFNNHIIENQDIDESSGLAVSTRYPNVLWTHNDSGTASIFYAMDFTGKHLGTFFMGGEFPRDWEDMSSFKLKGKSYLLIADTGDNNEIHYNASLSIYKEPDVYQPKLQQQIMEPLWTIDFQYPKDKSYDVESVAVDVVQNKIILLSKRNKKVHVFELPLQLDKNSENQILVAEKITKLNYFKRPAAMDISADGKQAAILVYGKVYLFANQNNQSWAKALHTPSNKINFKGLYQPEAISFDQQAKQLFISSEKLPAKLLHVKLE